MANIKAIEKVGKELRVNFASKMAPDERENWRDVQGWERIDFNDGTRGYWKHAYSKKLEAELKERMAREAREMQAKADARAKAREEKAQAKADKSFDKMTKAELIALVRALAR